MTKTYDTQPAPDAVRADGAPAAASLSKMQKMTSGIDLQGIGLEIGPSHSPVVPKREGYNVEILDHTDAHSLISKYRSLGVDESRLLNIEEVDYIWSGEPMDELTGRREYYDYIVASHVIEHTPCMLSFLQQCENMLKSEGILALAVPDKRFCFDALRPNTTTGDILQAYYERRKRHTPGTIFDHFSMVVLRGGVHTWGPADLRPLEFVHDLDEARQMMVKSMESDEYIDVHNWVFVPDSFRLILHDLKAAAFIGLVEAAFYDTDDFEFVVLLRKSATGKLFDRMQHAMAAADLR